jgi:ATP-dependent Clp protease protease subunit
MSKSMTQNAFEAALRTGAPKYIDPQSRYILPQFRERTAQGERIMDPYAKLFEERIIFLGVQIDDASADDVMAQLLCLESMDPDREISIYINSPGGSYTAMTAIYDTIQFIKPTVTTVCCNSLGSGFSRQAIRFATRSHLDSPAIHRRWRPGFRHRDSGQRNLAYAF